MQRNKYEWKCKHTVKGKDNKAQRMEKGRLKMNRGRMKWARIKEIERKEGRMVVRDTLLILN